jgi:hypothetical protein
MKNIKLAFLVYCTAMLISVCNISYAQDNDGSVFIEGRMSNSESILNCSGICSADSSGALGIGFIGENFESLGALTMGFSLSADYSRNRFTVNGNVLDVTEKGIHAHYDLALQSHPELVFSARAGVGWITSSSINLPDRTVFGGGSGIDLTYQMTPDSNVFIGFSMLPVSPANQADFYAKTVDIDFRWHP